MIQSYLDKTPDIHETAYIADGVHVLGDVVIGAHSSIWFGSVVRGDVHYIRIGERTNIQDCTVIHVNHDGGPTVVDDGVTVGHRAILHGCHVKSGSLIGMGAIVLDDVLVESNAFVAAGSVVVEDVPDLNALVHFTDKNFGYDQRLWLDWYLQQTSPPKRDLRRDP